MNNEAIKMWVSGFLFAIALVTAALGYLLSKVPELGDRHGEDQ